MIIKYYNFLTSYGLKFHKQQRLLFNSCCFVEQILKEEGSSALQLTKPKDDLLLCTIKVSLENFHMILHQLADCLLVDTIADPSRLRWLEGISGSLSHVNVC